jgi:NADPH-dependent glutamate synthase beta subunit-like oxidoreductase
MSARKEQDMINRVLGSGRTAMDAQSQASRAAASSVTSKYLLENQPILLTEEW